MKGKMESVKVTHYQIDSFEENEKLLVKVYNLNAKKEWKKQIAYYSFHSENERRNYIDRLVASYERWEQDKTERRKQRWEVKNNFKLGDVLYNSWGWEQTNVDFYQVVGLTAKTVKIRNIKGRFTEKSTGNSMAAYVTAVPDSFADDKIYAARITTSGNAASRLGHQRTEYLSRWDGQELYCSWYG